jgi:hypothetical protein
VKPIELLRTVGAEAARERSAILVLRFASCHVAKIRDGLQIERFAAGLQGIFFQFNIVHAMAVRSQDQQPTDR